MHDSFLFFSFEPVPSYLHDFVVGYRFSVVWYHFELMVFNIFDEFQSILIIFLDAQIIPVEPSAGCLLSPIDTIPEILDNFLAFWYNFFLTFLI